MRISKQNSIAITEMPHISGSVSIFFKNSKLKWRWKQSVTILCWVMVGLPCLLVRILESFLGFRFLKQIRIL